MQDAEHEESAPDAACLVISQLACSLSDTTQQIFIEPETMMHRIYGQDKVSETFRCRYGLNPDFYEPIKQSKLSIAGVDEAGEVRIIELPEHRFFIATLFLPQLTSTKMVPHPLVIAYLQASLGLRCGRMKLG